MPFVDLENYPILTPAPGCQIRTPFGQHLMLSRIEMAEGAVIPLHQHPHEQGGVVLEGRLELTIDGEVRILTPGQMYLIPPNTPHMAVAIGGPALAMDVFSPIREDYAQGATATWTPVDAD